MIPIKVPPLGESIVEAIVSRWLKREGERVAAGETLVELETDKVTVEVPATTAGVLVRRLHQEGDVVGVGAVLAELEGAGAIASAAAAHATGTPAAPVAAVPTPAPGIPAPPPPPAPSPPATPGPPPSPALAPAAPVPAAPVPAAPAPAAADAWRASPAARRIAEESALDLSSVPATGRGGVVSKPDVIDFLAARAAGAATPPPPVPPPPAPPMPDAAAAPEPPAPPAPAAAPAAVHPSPAGGPPRETREKMSTRRKRIAEHLLEAQHATAHLTTFNEIDMSVVESLRARVRDRIEKEHGVRLSFMPFFIRAACMALRQFPTVNARVDGDHIVYHHYVNMGIAVASDAGLVVPNIKDADSRGLLQVARDLVAIAKKARDGKLVMDDLTGGTFTITNGGVFGSLLSTPILNPPQSAILGMHAIRNRPVEHPEKPGEIALRPMMYLALSYDHRIVDGAEAVSFLVRIREGIERPERLMLDL